MYGTKYTIGQMRWRVTLATRWEQPDPTGTGIIESYKNPTEVYADITPVGTQTYIAGTQIDTPITHRVVFRWFGGLDMFDVILRSILLPDGTSRQEVFRIRRLAEWEGHPIYMVADVELEVRS